ncbi:MAG: hypothetical protein IPM47_18360 [Sphingobacteriales bacterium]|nr:MAG: hypothetical protein IPM47_18360 [Sphingobacteriales bacterium]
MVFHAFAGTGVLHQNYRHPGTSSDNGSRIISEADGYVVACGSIFGGGSNSGIGVFKSTISGEKVWDSQISNFPYDIHGWGLLPIPNAYIVSSYDYLPGSNWQDAFRKLNENGTVSNTLYHGDTLRNGAASMIYEQGKIVAATSYGIVNQYTHSVLLKLDTSLQITASYELENVGDFNFSMPADLLLLPTQEYILGIGAQNEPNKIYGYLRKTDTIGNTIWEQKLSEATPPIPLLHLVSMQNGNFAVSWMELLGGDTGIKASYFVRSYNTLGEIQWQYTFEAIGYGRNIQDLHVCANGDIIGCGYTGNFDITGNPTSWIFRLSPQGELIWMREYVYWESLAQFMLLYAVTEDPYGDIVATGYANRPDPETGFWKGQAVLLKVNAMGCFGEGGCTDTAIVHSVVTGMETPNNGSVAASPPPVKVAWLGYGELAVFYNLPAYPAAQLHLYDIQGRHIATQTLPPYDIFTPLQTPPLPPGIYLYAAEQGGMIVARGKVAVMR